MTVERFTEADNAYQNKRSDGSPYRPEPTAPNYAELSSLVDERDRALRAREEARTDLSYHLFKSDHLTLAFESLSNLPTWKDDLPVLRETIRRVRGFVIGRTNPFESKKDDPERWLAERKRWDADLDCLIEWQHKIKAYEDGMAARHLVEAAGNGGSMTPGLDGLQRPVKLADAAEVIGRRSDVIGRSLETAGCTYVVVNRRAYAEHEDLCKLFPRYRKHYGTS